VLAAASLCIGSAAANAQPMPGMQSATMPRQAMRKFWLDRVVWTRQYIVDAVADDRSAQAALNRLTKNQDDIGNAIVRYYGAAAGSQLTDLPKQHVEQVPQQVMRGG
jgi:hypothetical protein